MEKEDDRCKVWRKGGGGGAKKGQPSRLYEVGEERRSEPNLNSSWTGECLKGGKMGGFKDSVQGGYDEGGASQLFLGSFA